MNKTIEQWASLDIEWESFSLMPEAIQDLQELARQRDALLAMLDNVGDEKLLALIGCEDFNLYIDISKGSMK